MADRARIPDEAIVVRCGLPLFSTRPLVIACDEHPEGFYGFSVQTAADLTVEQLAPACDNRKVGFTTVGEIRSLGYDVIRTGREFHHATVTVPRDWLEEAANTLTRLFKSASNPNPRGRS